MRLVYITEYFHTPAEGGLMRTWELSKYLADQGHQVSVIAPAAHHMTGRLPDDFKGLRQVQDVAGIRVIKVRTAAGFRRGYTARLLYYLTTPVVSVLAALGERPDVVMASSPPFWDRSPGCTRGSAEFRWSSKSATPGSSLPSRRAWSRATW